MKLKSIILGVIVIGGANIFADNAEIKKTKAVPKYGKQLFSSRFDKKAEANIKYSGGFHFKNWSGSKAKLSGGLTGNSPRAAMEVKATSKGFSGRNSRNIKLPKNISAIIIIGKVIRSADYKGNNPMIFAWITDSKKQGKPYFYHLPRFKNTKCQNFIFTIPASKLQDNYKELCLNLTSVKTKDKTVSGGSIFYKNIKIFIK